MNIHVGDLEDMGVYAEGRRVLVTGFDAETYTRDSNPGFKIRVELLDIDGTEFNLTDFIKYIQNYRFGRQTVTVLPCPFCGEFPELDTAMVSVGGGDSMKIHICECRNKECPMQPGVRMRGAAKYDKDGFYKNVKASQEVIHRWNTRKESSDGTEEHKG